MRVTQTADEMILQETPSCLWLFGSFFILVSSIFVYGSLGGFSDYDRIPGWVITVTFFMGAIGISVGVWQIYRAPITIITINRRKKIVMHRRRGIFGSKSDEYGFDQVKHFRVVENVDDEGDKIWYLGLEFYGGKIIRLSSMPSRSVERDQTIAERTNLFLRK
jgi:hypothetical protein